MADNLHLLEFLLMVKSILYITKVNISSATCITPLKFMGKIKEFFQFCFQLSRIEQVPTIFNGN